MKTKKRKKRKEKKTPQKMNSSLRKIINNFRAFLPTTLSQKMKVKKNFEKKILNKKKKNLVTLKNKKEMFFWTKFD